ncbi:MAG: exopolyphosphatase [Thiotrichales bacterium]
MPDTSQMLAAIDLGSNSFHMVVASLRNEQLEVIDRHKEMVRLAGGLDASQRITPEAADRALACLRRFAQRLRGLPPENIRIVGTNTLRRAKNAEGFLEEAEEILNHPIEIISGVEEARLVYLGVSHSLPSISGRRLIIDIGGSSTELTVGEGFDPLLSESLNMGCVSFTERFFPKGVITTASWNDAVSAAELKLLWHANEFRSLGWVEAVGSSGSMRSTEEVVVGQGWSPEGITLAGMQELEKAILKAGNFAGLRFGQLTEERRPVFVGGVVIIKALMEILGLKTLKVAQGALREGVLYDMAGSQSHADVRRRTIDHLTRRFAIYPAQAERAKRAAQQLLDLGAASLKLSPFETELLLWAAELHEIGLSISHHSFNKHGAYVIENADMPGFTQTEQRLLATLICAQRRKLGAKLFADFDKRTTKALHKLALLLRVALVLSRERRDTDLPLSRLTWRKGELQLEFPLDWLDQHPLTRVDLETEAEYFDAVGFKLSFS